MEVVSLTLKCAESKKIQKVLDLSELKIVKPPDICWHAYWHCVKSAIVLALENIYETSHEPEALGQIKSLSSHYIITTDTFFLKRQNLSMP